MKDLIETRDLLDELNRKLIEEAIKNTNLSLEDESLNFDGDNFFIEKKNENLNDDIVELSNKSKNKIKNRIKMEVKNYIDNLEVKNENIENKQLKEKYYSNDMDNKNFDNKNEENEIKNKNYNMFDTNKSVILENNKIMEFSKISGETKKEYLKDLKKIILEIDEINKLSRENVVQNINEIYKNYNVSTDVKNGIYMVDIYKRSFPESMDMASKKTSIRAILDGFEIDTNALIDDANFKISILEEIKSKTNNRSIFIKSVYKKMIEELNRAIDELKYMTEERDEFQAEQNSILEDEINFIKNIKDYLV